MPNGPAPADARRMLMITETSSRVRLSCESCGSETTINLMSLTGTRPAEECAVCGAWERIRPAADKNLELPPLLN
jgi:hypothetical protein